MKGLIVFSNGMEDNEAIGTLALLRRAGLEVASVSSSESKQIKTAYGIVVTADYLLDELNLNDYQFLIIPGGGYVTKVVEQDQVIKSLITTFNDQNKVIAAICAAPLFIGSLGLLKEHDYTCFPGIEQLITNGTYLGSRKAVISGSIITARSAGAVVEFAYEIVKKIKSEDAAKRLIESIYY